MSSSFRGLAFVFLICLFQFTQQFYAQEDSVSKNILFVYGGWEGHEPEKCKDIFVPWLIEKGYNVTVSDSVETYADSVIMSSIDLVIQTVTMSTISNKQANGLLNAVKNGTALAGWHGGLGDSFRNNTGYQYMVGGQWVAHPGGKVEYTVNISNNSDPIMEGLNDFKMNSEQYFMHVDPSNEVLAKTTFTGEHDSWVDGTIMPVVWKKKFGKGRVFYSSLGHSAADFDVPEALTIMKRGILWAIDDL